MARQLRADGVAVRLGTRATAVEVSGHARHLAVTGPGGADRVPFDRLLLAVGRAPRTGSLGTSAAGVELDERGAVVVDERSRTTNHRIYAAGDVTLRLPFTHVAAAHAATVVQNVLFGWRAEVDHDRIPWVTFSSPEVARVGLTVAEDVAGASLQELRATLARLRPLTRSALLLGRFLRR